MKIECTIPGKTSLLEIAMFIKVIVSHKRRQIGRMFIFFSLFLGVQSALEVGPTSYETPSIYFFFRRSETAKHFRIVFSGSFLLCR